MKKAGAICLAILLLCCSLGGCAGEEEIQTDEYEYLIGVSLTNVIEPWLNNLVHVISQKEEEDATVNLIFRDAAGSTEKQIQDIEALMDCGIDLLILSTDGSDGLNEMIEKTYQKIPVLAVGVAPDTDAYTTVIQADDKKIGSLAGEYVLEHFYKKDSRLMVLEGVEGSPISEKRLEGFYQAVDGKIPESQITCQYGEWLRDRAEARMKDYLVADQQADIVVAFNDEMAYGAYLAYQQLRMDKSVHFIGVDGFEGEIAGLDLVKNNILDATIQSPDIGALTFDTALGILKGQKVARNITIEPRLITRDE